MDDRAIFKAPINELPRISRSCEISYVCYSYTDGINNFIAVAKSAFIFAPAGIKKRVLIALICILNIFSALRKNLKV